RVRSRQLKGLTRRVRPWPLSNAELAARDDDRRTAHLHTIDSIAVAEHTRVQRRGTTDLRALRDLDLVPVTDAAVTYEMNGERSRCRARGRVLDHAQRGGEHARLPMRRQTGEAADSGVGQPGERAEVRCERRDLIRAAELDEHVTRAKVVQLHG